MKEYPAPWSRPLLLVSCLVTGVCIAVAGLVWLRPWTPSWLALVPLGIVGMCALFTVRGYSLAPDGLRILRLFWETRLPLDGLQSAEFRPDAMRWSLRTFGNGGLFSFSGWYYNRTLGCFRAWVTDLRPTVVLRWPRRTVVVSPGDPERFVREVRTRFLAS